MSSSKLSQLAETLIGSEIVRLGAEVKERRKQGHTVFNYTIGDFDSSIFPIPQELEDEIIQAYKQHYTTYPPAEGLGELRKSVSNFIEEREKIAYNDDEILIAAGGRPLIYTAFRAIVDKHDKVIYSVPSWNNNHYVHFTDGEHIVIEAKHENNFMPTADEIQPHIRSASLLALCSPLNPTGTAFSEDELTAICDMVISENNRRGDYEKRLYLLYDQIYWTLTYGNTQHVNPVSIRPEMKKYTIFIDGISKAFAATGVRVGWAMGPKPIINKMKAINSHIGAWAPMAEQKAVANYLLQTKSVDLYLNRFKEALAERLQKIFIGFQQLKYDGFAVDAIAPQAAIYLAIQFDLIGKKTDKGEVLSTQAQVTEYILSEAKLAVVPFYAFGTPNSSWYRLSVGTCKLEEIDEILGILREALSRLH